MDNPYPLLEQIDTPADLRRLSLAQLDPLAHELRAFLIDSVQRTGGHMAAGLGVVELTLALHYVFNTPDDALLWDTGHQCYPHKILTGRRTAMRALRQSQGPAGFPRREESPYDAFGVGHSGTSLSAALGMALAQRLRGGQSPIVTVIGDGALSAGMAFEALNHAGEQDADLLVVLNDNEMSISPNVGALSRYLTRLISGRAYRTVRAGGKKVLEQVPPVWEFARRAREHVKGMLLPGTLFEELGFHYYGPIDGHDVSTLVETLRNLRGVRGPRLLHVVTRKGKDYAPAEQDPCGYHGVAAPTAGTARGTSYTEVFGEWLCAMAAQDPAVVAITPAMREGSGLVAFARQFPERFFDVGIAEQHAVTLAAGLACRGLKPVVAIYSSFLQRAYDQLIHDVALQNLPVVFAIDRAGLVGPDGPTHAGAFDVSFLRCVPNLTLMTPADADECWCMLYTATTLGTPVAVRYPRGAADGAAPRREMTALPIGVAEPRREGKDIALLAFGPLLHTALSVAARLDASVINMRFVKPLDKACVLAVAARHRLLVTLEDNAVAGGAGSAVTEYLHAQGITTPVLSLGLPDRFVEHGTPAEQRRACGLDEEGILARLAQHPAAL